MWIRNVSAPTIALGLHPSAEILIQIGNWQPMPKKQFLEIHPFWFTAGWMPYREVEIMRNVLTAAKLRNQDVIVQCFAGIQRSGAVVEYAKTLGFEDRGTFRWSSDYVFRRLMGDL